MNIAADKQWSLDKRIPVPTILAFLLQIGGFAWYGATLNAQVEQNAKDIASIERSLSEYRNKNSDVKDRVIRIEEKLVSQRDLLERILKRVDGR